MLLGYAAETGIPVDDKFRGAILKARIALDSGGMSEETAANFLAALTSLAASTKPVTAESLKECRNGEALKTIHSYGAIAISIAVVIVVISLLTFVSNRVSERIKTDIELANTLASKLAAELGPGPGTNNPSAEVTSTSESHIWFGANKLPVGVTERDVITDLQQFAATMRGIHGYAGLLNYFVFNAVTDPSEIRTNRMSMELTPGLPRLLAREFQEKVRVYQNVRYYGISVAERVSVFYGAIASCILPVLYALLGAGAYLLRSYEDQIKNRTYVRGDRNYARFLVAGIGGLVVGLFNVAQGVTISPFAVAFLVGYAADVFFTFLEGLLQSFRRGPASAPTPSAQSAAPK